MCIKVYTRRVGNDLQYIRLNGAVVGGIAGIVIGLLKFTLLRYANKFLKIKLFVR